MQIDRVDLGKAVAATDFERNLEKSFQRLMDQLVQVLNKGLLFDDNFNGFKTTITTDATPGAQTAISHGLKKIPVGCLVLEKNKAAHIYLGASGKSATVYYVASDIASVTATLLIF